MQLRTADAMQVTALPPSRIDEASQVLADAYQDDPGWVAIGPRDPRRRNRYARRVCHGALRVVAAHGGEIWQVERDGRVAGVLSTMPPGTWPPPHLKLLIAQALGPVLAGPSVLWRSIRADSVMQDAHPRDPHYFVWMLGVAPAHQRTGVGRALLGHGLARADELGIEAYLETANPENLPYYASFGFERTGERMLPGDAPIWFMHRWSKEA
jgi:ribosomal protein S18 acetylase RimI-like enzyme